MGAATFRWWWLAAAAAGCASPVHEPAPELRGSAVALAAARLGVPASTLSIANERAASYPLSGVTTRAFKIFDPARRATVGVELTADGREVDGRALAEADEQLRAARYGRLDAALFDALAGADPDLARSVQIRLAESGYVPPRLPDPSARWTRAQMDDFRASVRAKRSAFVKSLTDPLFARLGEGERGRASDSAPIVYARLTPSRIREATSWSGVDRIYAADARADDQLANAVPNIHGDIVRGRGITGVGSGSNIAVVDAKFNVLTTHPNIDPSHITNNPLFPAVPGLHIDQTVGCILSNTTVSNPTSNLGVAVGADVWIDGATSQTAADLEAVTNHLLATANVDLFNMSWQVNHGSTPDGEDKFYDGIVFNFYDTIIAAAGDYGNAHAQCCKLGSCDNAMGAPARGYNVITVGGYSQSGNNVIGSSSWTTNNVWDCSSTQPPSSTHGDRIKPEVSAPAALAAMPNLSGGFSSEQGTSFSAPLVTGVAALAIQRDGLARGRPFVPILNTWPEAIKAILMVTATDDITNGGAAGDPRLSLGDGAGGVVADQVDNVAANFQWGGNDYTGTSCGSISSFFFPTTIHLTAGNRTRIAIVWDTNPSDTTYSSLPTMDMDLIIFDPNNSQVASSTSYDNNYELVDFTPGITGTYTVQEHKFGCNTNNSPGRVAWAWISGSLEHR